MTNPTDDQLFARFNANPPASFGEIEELQGKLSFALPESYVEFMRAKNGGEGFIGNSYLVLWKVEELFSMNAAYRVPEFASGLFLFGSNGGGEAYGFDTRFEAPTILSIPFVPMETHDALEIASDFEAFLSVLSQS